MKLSIITINYNNLEGLRKTIDSVLCQTWKDFEWIFIDGGSTDGSKELIEKTAAECPNVSYWCSEPDKGVYDAQNKGVLYATGDYLCFMNSGDCFHSSSTLFDVFSQNPEEDIIYGDTSVVGGGIPWVKSVPKVISPCVLLFDTLCHQSCFIKRILQKEHLYEIRFKIFADREFFYYALFNDYSFRHIGSIVSDYDVNGISAQYGFCKELEDVINRYYPKTLVSDLEELRKFVEYPELIELHTLISERRINRWLFRKIFAFIKFLFLLVPRRRRS